MEGEVGDFFLLLSITCNNNQTMNDHTPSFFLRLVTAALLVPLFSFSALSGQSVFQHIEAEQVTFSDDAISTPESFAAFRAADSELRTTLEKTIQNNGYIELPLPSGEFISVQLHAYKVAEEGFYKRFPLIQTYQFESKDGKITGFGSMSDRGFHAVGRSPEGQFYIDPTQKDMDNKTYAIYYTEDYALPSSIEQILCDNNDLMDDIDEPGISIPSKNSSKLANREPLRQYRLAIATTGEYSQFHGGTKEDVAAELVNLMIRVNEVMRREFSIEYILIDQTDTLFFLDPETDGFTNGNTSALIGQVDRKISDLIPSSEYDIGHLLCTINNSIGGLATTSAVCRESRKRRGVSCSGNPVGDRFYVELVCHEIGHQMGSRHSFNHCRGENENLPTGYEPGSGTTIMAYAGLCGPNNVSTITDPYYNIGSIESIESYMHNGFGNNCAEETERPGQVPTLEFPFDASVPAVIPASTPFELTAGAAEEDPDLLYCWEQYDASPFNCNTNDPTDNCPLFRSFPPTTNPTRVFPRIQNLVNQTNNRWEKLPDYSRSMQFMCTLRDWDPDGGAIDWGLVQMEVEGSAGPFTVEPISGTYEVGDQMEIVWDVANTDQAPISCDRVDIYLSEDGGFTYPHILAEGVPNTGSLTINTPDLPTPNGKIKVKASGNFFFNISGSTFSILMPSEPGFSASFPAFFEQVCLPNEGLYSIETQSILDFQEDISLSHIEGLPAGASWETSPALIQAGEDIDVIINFGDSEKQSLRLQAVFTSLTEDTVRVELQTRVVSNDFADLNLVSPPLNQENTSTVTDFSWTEVEDALEYRVELSTSPSFEFLSAEVVVDSGEANFNALVNYQLQAGVTYYWRVVPINECGDGTPSSVFTLRTGAVSCERYTAIDLPKTILPTSNAMVESVINIAQQGTVDAVEVRNLRGTHPFVGEIRARLESPAGTAVRLFTERCFNVSDFDVNFSDLAASDLQCPLSGGDTYRPQDELGGLAGESTQGDWKLIIEDRTAGNGGSFQSWELELCGALSVSAPSLAKDTLYVARGEQQFLKNNNLTAQKNGLSPFDLIYTVVDAPKHGVLRYGDITMQAGDKFNQDAVDRWYLNYEHNGSDEDRDFITFVLEDSEGGWIGLDTLPIKVDAILRAESASVPSFKVYPNPTSDVFFVYPPEHLRQGELEIFDVQGRIIRTVNLKGANRVKMARNGLTPGLYYIQLKDGDQRVTQKLIVQ